MGNLLCFAYKYLTIAEFLNYIFVVLGVIVAVISLRYAYEQLKINNQQLRMNTEAQQDVLAPRLAVFYNGDKIKKSFITNIGKIAAKQIDITIVAFTNEENAKPKTFEVPLEILDVHEVRDIMEGIDTSKIHTIEVSVSYQSLLNDRSRNCFERISRNG